MLAAPHPLVHHSPRGHGTHTLTRHAFIQLHFTDIPPPPSSCSECTMNPVSKCGNQLSYPLASHVMPQHPCVHARGPPTYPAPTVTIVTSVVLPGPRVCSHPPLHVRVVWRSCTLYSRTVAIRVFRIRCPHCSALLSQGVPMSVLVTSGAGTNPSRVRVYGYVRWNRSHRPLVVVTMPTRHIHRIYNKQNGVQWKQTQIVKPRFRYLRSDGMHAVSIYKPER